MQLPIIFNNKTTFISIAGAILLIIIITLFFGYRLYEEVSTLKVRSVDLATQKEGLNIELEKVQKEYTELKNQDQIKINQSLQKEIKNIHDTYLEVVSSYEDLQDLKTQNSKLDKKYDTKLAASLKYLSGKNYASAAAILDELEKGIKTERDKIAPSLPSGKSPANLPQSNSPPSSGFSRQAVKTDKGTFTVDIISADLNSTKVIVDTASDSDCSNDCPVLSLGEYVSRSGAFAGINGPFFCPAAYPSCAGKTNSFDTLLMNKNKHYFNSDNNVYSVVPAAIFGPGWARFVGQSLEWGRDTSVDSVIANHPLYVQGSNIAFGGSGDVKIDSKGSRTFIAHKGNIVYIGIVYGASGSDAASVLKALGMDDAIGLDQGGSTALYFGGYKAGPGRGIPSAILFVKR